MQTVFRLLLIVVTTGFVAAPHDGVASPTGTPVMVHEELILVDDRIFMSTEEGVVEIENITAYCLGCHDGAIGPSRQTPSQTSSDAGPLCTGLPGVHPVGAHYPAGSRKFNDPAGLPTTMYFSNGSLTCVSCHDFQARDHHLAVSNRGSALCLTCHNK